MSLLYLKAIHIVFVVSWFAGLFYIVRLFIYHVEAGDRPELERKVLQDQYKIMEWRLWYIITVPAMVISIATGVAMLLLLPGLLKIPWMHVKLGFVVLLLAYHACCWKILHGLQRDVLPASSLQLRMFNEIATLLLVAIVFTVILKSTGQWIWGVGGLVVLGVIFMIVIKLVNRNKK